MSERANWTRRSVLGYLSGLLALIAFRATDAAGAALPRAAAIGRPHIEPGHLFTQRASATALGREYLRQAPEPHDADQLRELILGDCTVDELRAIRRGRAGTRETMRALRRRDFETGRVVNVDGWVLSLTEARLFGLAALLF